MCLSVSLWHKSTSHSQYSSHASYRLKIIDWLRQWWIWWILLSNHAKFIFNITQTVCGNRLFISILQQNRFNCLFLWVKSCLESFIFPAKNGKQLARQRWNEDAAQNIMASSQSSVITQERKNTFLVQVYCGYCMDCMFVHLAMSLIVNLIHMSTLDFLHSIYRFLQLKTQQLQRVSWSRYFPSYDIYTFVCEFLQDRVSNCTLNNYCIY